MYETIIVWAGLGLLFLLCLPFAGLQRLLLFIYGLGLRLGMIALIVAAGYLWFRPAELPAQVADVVRNTYVLHSILPEPGTPVFGVCAAGLAAAVLLPLIAVFDLCRRPIVREQTVVKETVRVEPAAVVPVAAEPAMPAPRVPPAPAPSRFGRRDAAATMTQAGSTR